MPWESWIKPENCPGPCTACEPGDHHWMEDFIDPEDEDQQGHPALLTEEGKKMVEDVGALMVWQCKHCDAWKWMTDEALDEADF